MEIFVANRLLIIENGRLNCERTLKQEATRYEIRKMIFILHRYIFREVFKVFILTAVALTLILSLGSVLGPVQKYGVGPQQVLQLMGYFLPITLTFVLPIAALFAAALVYGRFAGDNELDACRASGISLLSLIYPGLALAIMVAIGNLMLSFYVMPAFVHRAEKSIKADAKQILFRNIQRRGYYAVPDHRHMIYADQANSQNDTLSGVIIVKTKLGDIQEITVAEKARVHFISHDNFNEVQITAYNTSQMDSEDEAWFYAQSLSLTAEFGSLLGDNIRFKKIGEMKRIRDVDPMAFYPIAKLARQVQAQFCAELLAEDISSHVTRDPWPERQATSNERRFYKLHSGEKFIEFRANRCRVRDEKRVELAGEVFVKESDVASGRLLRILRCTKAVLRIEGEEVSPNLTMELYSPHWQQANGEEGMAAGWFRIRGLILPNTVKDHFNSTNILKNIQPEVIVSALNRQPEAELKRLLNELKRILRRTMVEIEAETHSRLVFGTGCIAMIVIGIGLGIILKGGHLLNAFGVSCVPAALLIVCIMSGYQIARNPDAHAGSGIGLMWAGLGLLVLLAAGIYHRLMKN